MPCSSSATLVLIGGTVITALPSDVLRSPYGRRPRISRPCQRACFAA